MVGDFRCVQDMAFAPGGAEGAREPGVEGQKVGVVDVVPDAVQQAAEIAPGHAQRAGGLKAPPCAHVPLGRITGKPSAACKLPHPHCYLLL